MAILTTLLEYILHECRFGAAVMQRIYDRECLQAVSKKEVCIA
jgi:hypothetical protein